MNKPSISIDQLRLFVEVSKAGSLAAVARKLGLDPSAVSRQISTLESELGFRLFDRTTRRLHLTEAGQIYLEHTRILVDELDFAREAAVDSFNEPKGQLRVTTSNAFAERWLITKLQPFCDDYPDISLDLNLTDSNIDIAAEGIDIAIRLTQKPEGALVATKLMDTRYRVVVSPDYIAKHPSVTSPEFLSDHRCLLLPLPGYCSLWRFRRDGQVIKVPVKGRITASGPLALLRAASEGLGPALLANWAVDQDIQDGKLIDLFPDWEVSAEDFDTAAWILYPDRNYVSRKSRIFINYLKSCV